MWSSYKLVWNKIKVKVSQRETDIHLLIAREWVGGLLGAAFQHLQGGNQEDKAKLFTQMLRGRTDNSHPLNWGRFHLDLRRGKIIYYGVLRTMKLIKTRVQGGWGISTLGGFQDVTVQLCSDFSVDPVLKNRLYKDLTRFLPLQQFCGTYGDEKK